MQIPDDEMELMDMRARLLASPLFFTQTFYKLRTDRDFNISHPTCRESHQITICRELLRAFKLEVNRLIFNIEPGSGKSELLRHFVAWAFAHYPDSQFIYCSYSKDLAAQSTAIIKDIMTLPFYRKIFGIKIRNDASAKTNFITEAGGKVYAAGSTGTITGFDAGLPIGDRFSGALLMDDMHKPDEVFSDTTRESVKKNYKTTLMNRPRSPVVPQIFIGQRLHEDDLPASLLKSYDGYNWDSVILKSIDDAGNILNPTVHNKEFLDNLKEYSPYEFAAQFQQDPQPAGGGIIKPEGFVFHTQEPAFISTFITCDTSETEKTYNDATVFSHWGLYRIKQGEVETDLYGLHWINCVELRVEPKDLLSEWQYFYAGCMRHKVKPGIVAIEKKSTGVTLLSVLSDYQGIQLMDIERTKASGCKVVRFFEMQPYIHQKLISFTLGARHAQMCIDQCKKLTSNNTHAHDDIADTLYDAIKIGLIDKIIVNRYDNRVTSESDAVVKSLADGFARKQNVWRHRYGTDRY